MEFIGAEISLSCAATRPAPKTSNNTATSTGIPIFNSLFKIVYLLLFFAVTMHANRRM
jgi:hypothetical protein